MCRLLVRVVDKLAADASMERMLTKRGDVIVRVPDGWQFSQRERTNPEWMIIDLPGVPDSETGMLVEKEAYDRQNPFARKRTHFLDFTTLPLSQRVHFNGTVRSRESITLSLEDLRGMATRKAAVREIRGR